VVTLSSRAAREGTVLRIAVMVLGVSVIVGLSLDEVIPYTPAFPIVVLAASLLCLAAAVRAGRYTRLLPDAKDYVGGLLYTAFAGSVVDLLFSGVLGLMAALHMSSRAAPGGSRDVLIALSCPAFLISVVAFALARRVTRQASGRGRRH
jgi:purine-cytosine permease-like protein